MTYLPNFETSSIKSDLLKSKAGAEISGVVTAHFDKNDISNTSVSSTNDYQFTLSSASGSSFILEGGILIDNVTNNATTSVTIRWYDETNSQFIGTKGFVYTKINPTNVDPFYSSTASAVILASDFNGSDIVVSLRATSTSGNATYPASLVGSNGRNIQAIFKILQT